MAGRDAGRGRARRPAARALPAGSADRPGPRWRGPLRRAQHHALHQHDSGLGPGGLPRRHRSGTAAGRLSALERHGHGAARRQDLGRGRAHRHLCVGDHAVRNRLPPLLPRRHARVPGRHAVHPGPFGARHLRARLPGRPLVGRRAGPLPPRDRRRRAGLVSAPAHHAGLLAVPYRVDGPGPADGRLPGALHALPGRPRADSRAGPQGLGIPGRRRAGPAETLAAVAMAGREARQPDLRGQLQPATPGRSGARQRQDHAGAGKRVSRRRLERDQGGLGRRLGRAAGPGP